MLGAALALGSLAALVWAARSAPPDERESGATEAGQRRYAQGRHRRVYAKGAELEAMNRKRDLQRLRRAAVRAGVDCCDAPSDSWRSETYRQWQAPNEVSWDDAYGQCYRESVAASEAGDYSKPADRRCTLGKRHAYKLMQWDECRRRCRGEVPSDGLVVVEDGADTFVSDGEAGATVYRVRESARGATLEDWSGGGQRLIGEYDSAADAVQAARDLISAPF